MIIPDNKPSSIDNGASDTSAPISHREHDELPPPYAGIQDAEPSSSTGRSSRLTSRAPQIPASNFVFVKRENNGIADSYVIDTQLQVPESVISPIAEGGVEVNKNALLSGERPHIYLESIHGAVNADIWLVRGAGEAQPGQDAKTDSEDRALVTVKSSNSSVNTKLHCDSEQPYLLCCSSQHGTVNVSLPSTFVGPATITTTHGKVILSPAVQARCTTFSEMNNVRTCFIGDYGAAGFRSLNEWKGSMLQLSTYTSKIKVGFNDEVVSPSQTPAEGGGGFSWSNMFRFTW